MKKNTFKFIYILLLLLPATIHAYGIENYYINATLEEDGDLRVQEYFNLEGEYNGFEKKINYENPDAYPFHPELDYYGGSDLHNGTDIIINEIRAVSVNPNFDFSKISGEKFIKTSSAEKGDYGVYTTTKNWSGYSYLIYLPSKKNKAFYIDYTIKNIAILHNDVGELGWNIFNSSFSESIGYLQIKVHFPNNQNEFKVWAHGPLNGLVAKEGTTTLIATIEGLSAHRAIDIRATFDQSVISQSPKKSNVIALQKILNYEENKANQANYEREQTDYLNQSEALNKINYCFKNTTRDCYNEAVRLVNKIEDVTVKTDYTNRLSELEVVVIDTEEKIAKESVKDAEDFINYHRYEKAYQNTIILTNEELKQDLLKRLEIVKEKIIKEEKEKYKTFQLINISTIIIIIVIIIYIYNNHDKEYPHNFNHRYLREIPNNYSPSTVTYLFKRTIDSNAISAEVLKLMNDDIIKIEKIKSDKKEDYQLSINSSYKKELTPKENKLITLIFNDKEEIKLSEMKSGASRKYRSFINKWESVNKECLKEASANNFYPGDENVKYKDKSLPGIILCLLTYLYLGLMIPLIAITQSILLFFGIGIIFMVFIGKMNNNVKDIEIKKSRGKTISNIILGTIIPLSLIFMIYAAIVFHFINNKYILSILCLILSIIGIIYVNIAQKRTEKGSYEYARWKAFKRFLLDFGKMDIKDVGEVKLWQEYLVYATTLGIADKVQKAMQIKIDELGLTGTNIDYINFSAYNSLSRSISDGVRDSYSRATTSSSASSSSSSYSSGGGGGGGFSSGGGSFGGGSGGGRF